MELYHVTCKKYRVGQVLNALNFERTEYYVGAERNNLSWIDDFLDAKRGQSHPSRSNTLFAFDCEKKCKAFASSRSLISPIFYQVEMVEPVACPMHLVGLISKANSDEFNNRIAQEYWHPTQDWKYLEYLSVQMEIKSIVDASNPYWESAGRMAIGLDRDKAKYFFLQ